MASLLLFALCGCPAAGQSSSPADVEPPRPAEVDGPDATSNATDAGPEGGKTVLGQRADSLNGREDERASETEQDANRLDRVQFSGQIFTRYGWNTTGTGAAKNFNSFALDRWYFTARTALSDDLRFRGTTDIVAPRSDGGVGYMIVVKYAYLNWQVRPNLELRAGVHQTGWENYMNSVWGYRGTSRTMAHYQGHISTSDLGATLSYKLPSQWGTASVGIHNGQGFRRLETDQFKDVSGQVRLTPFADSEGFLAPLQVSSHVYRGTHNNGLTRLRWGGLVAYSGDRYTLALNYEARKDGGIEGGGISTFGTLQVGTLGPVGDVSLLGMFNLYDSNDTEQDDRSLRSVMGVAVQPTSKVTVTLDYQQVRMQRPAFTRYDGGQTDLDGDLFLHVILNY